MSKKKIGISIVTGIILLSLAIVFYFYDLAISKTIYVGKESFLFTLIASIGEFPIYFGPLMLGLIFGITSNKKNHKLLFHFVGLITMYIASIRLVKGVFTNFYSSKLGMLQYSLLALEALLVYILLMILFSKFKIENLIKLRKVALIYSLVSLSSFLIVSVLKLIWGRTRFYALSSDYNEFSNFLTINIGNGLKGDEYNSFPSGHTSSATTSLVLILIPLTLSNKKLISYLTGTVCFLYVLLVAISRVGYGAHYASDVLFGFVICCSCFMIIYNIFKKKGWLDVRNN